MEPSLDNGTGANDGARASATAPGLGASLELALHLHFAHALTVAGPTAAPLVVPVMIDTLERYRYLVAQNLDAQNLDTHSLDTQNLEPQELGAGGAERVSELAHVFASEPAPLTPDEALVSVAVRRRLADLLQGTEAPAESSGAAAVEAEVLRRVQTDPSQAGVLSLYGRRTFGRTLLAASRLVDAYSAGERESATLTRLRAYVEHAGDDFAAGMNRMGLNG